MLTALAPDFNHFWRAWSAFACAAVLGAIVLTVGFWVLEALWPSDGVDMSPLVVILLTGSALWPTLWIGLFIVPFRRLVVRPGFPFLRWGYLAVAALPVLYALAVGGTWDRPLLNPIDAQIWLLVSMPMFALLSRRFGALGDKQRSGTGGAPGL